MEYYFHAGVVQLAATWILQNPVNMHPMYKPPPGFPTGVENMGGGALKSIHGGSMGGT